MSIDTTTTAEARREVDEAVERLRKGVYDADAVRRACERMDREREELRKKIGTIEMAVDLIRDAQSMKLVLDACIAIKWFLPEPDSEKAVSLREQFRNQVHELIAPDTLPVEVAHALTRAERKNVLFQGDVMTKVADLLSVGLALHDNLSLLSRAVELSSQARIGVFDCIYVALAEREQCQVVTVDQRMIALFPSEVVSLAEF